MDVGVVMGEKVKVCVFLHGFVEVPEREPRFPDAIFLHVDI